MSDTAAHSSLGPSGAYWWMRCAGGPNAVAGLPNDSNEAAAEGTAAHTISDLCLSTGLNPHDLIGMVQTVEGFQFTWTAEDADLLSIGIDQIREFGGEFFGEHRVNLSKWLGPDQFGTLDRAVILPDQIVICDLKWGRRIAVSPVENEQLMLYGLGFWWNVARHVSSATEFLFLIDQPRCGGGGGEWRCTLDDLLAFGERATVAAATTRDPNAPRTAGPTQCVFCRRKDQPPSEPGAVTGCKTYDDYISDLLDVEFDDLDAPIRLPDTVSIERRSHIIRHRSMIEQWLELLWNSALMDAQHGYPTPGFKAIEGRAGRRKWADEIAASEALDDVLTGSKFTFKLKSPAQVEKEIGKKALAEQLGDLVHQPDCKPVLVPDADARAPLPVLDDDEFDDLEPS